MEGKLVIFIALVVIYFIVLLSLGIFAYKRTKKTPEDYFLASRSFGPVILLFTLAATNFSAFTFLGFAGNAYKTGFGQYGIMGFGTAIMAIMFYVIGRKVWKLGKEKSYITPPELIGDRFNSYSLRLLFMGVMVVFTIPYLAVQAIGAGIIIQNMTNIGWQVGAIVTMIVIMFYVLSGGMRGSGWTDVIQGIIMILAMVFAVVIIAINLGGFEAANTAAYNANPEMFTRPGGEEFFLPQIWFSFMLLWIFADPMFPQIFSRFYTAKDQKSLKMSTILYPVVVSFLFLFPVLIGVWARGAGLEIANGQYDVVLPMMVEKYASSVYAFVMIGALAALMSTADSQLLSLSTMLSRDLPFKKFKISEIFIGKILIAVLSIFAIIYVISGYDPKAGIMGTLVSTTFSGLAVLCPTTIAALYWKRATRYGCMASIIIGEISVFLFQYKVLPTFGFLAAIWGILIAIVILVVVSYLTKEK
ncbi:MAG: sodium:solute symporter family protein [Candidatus Asgardarchaeum californiense]|nr:MAG: sodium:solute symporter family protein [Candidatus Asgardarchaeum californiense]